MNAKIRFLKDKISDFLYKNIYDRAIYSFSFLALLSWCFEPIIYYYPCWGISALGKLFLSGIIVIIAICLAIVITCAFFIAVFYDKLLSEMFPRLSSVITFIFSCISSYFLFTGFFLIPGIWALLKKKYLTALVCFLFLLISISTELFDFPYKWLYLYNGITVLVIIGIITKINPEPRRNTIYIPAAVFIALWLGGGVGYYYTLQKQAVMQNHFSETLRSTLIRYHDHSHMIAQSDLSEYCSWLKQLPAIKPISLTEISILQPEFETLLKEYQPLIAKVNFELEQEPQKLHSLLQYSRESSDYSEALLNWFQLYCNIMIISAVNHDSTQVLFCLNKLKILKELPNYGWGISSGLLSIELNSMYNKYLKDIISLSTLSPHELQKLHNELSNTEKKWENLYIQKSKETLVSSSIYLREYFEKNVFAECEYDENETFHLIPVDPINLRYNFSFYGILKNCELFSFYKVSQQYLEILEQPLCPFENKLKNIAVFEKSFQNSCFLRYVFVQLLKIKSAQNFLIAAKIDQETADSINRILTYNDHNLDGLR